MKNLTIIMLFCLIGLNPFGQDENVIELGSEVTLTLSKGAGNAFTYKITEVKKFDKNTLIISNAVLKGKVDTNQVKLFFCKGKFGYNTATLLIIKNGLKGSLKYAAKIKIGDQDSFKNTSVEPLFPNVKSIEEWPYDIAEISLSDFSVTEY
jgi:hypothetical protein